MKFWVDNLINPSWDKWVIYKYRIEHGLNNLNWWVDQDFLNCIDNKSAITTSPSLIQTISTPVFFKINVCLLLTKSEAAELFFEFVGVDKICRGLRFVS